MSSNDLPSTIKLVTHSYHFNGNKALLEENDVYDKILNIKSTLHIFDATDTEHNISNFSYTCAFSMVATMLPTNKKPRLQHLRLLSSRNKTFHLRLEHHKVIYPGDPALTFSLSGRGTSPNREIARKQFLTGLGSANYSGTIEEARDRTLFLFARGFIPKLFKLDIDNSTYIQDNINRTYRWLVKMLG